MTAGVVHSGFLEGFAKVVGDLGGDPLAIAHVVSLRPDALWTEGLTLPGGPVLAFMERAAETCDAPDLGLQLAIRRGGLHMMGPIWVLMRSAPTVGEALAVAGEHLPFRVTMVSARAFPEGDTGVLTIDSNAPGQRDVQAIEFCFGIVAFQLRAWLGPGWRPITTQFRHAAPERRTTHAAVFGHTVQFDQDRNAMVIDCASWGAALPSRNPSARQMLTQAMREERSFASDDFVSRVSQQLRASLPYGRTGLEMTARELGIPPRTLQHRLRGCGATYHGLLDAVRVELALRYLQSSLLSAAQIGEMLQFADGSAFSRFVKQQTGRSPRQIRRAGFRAFAAGDEVRP